MLIKLHIINCAWVCLSAPQEMTSSLLDFEIAPLYGSFNCVLIHVSGVKGVQKGWWTTWWRSTSPSVGNVNSGLLLLYIQRKVIARQLTKISRRGANSSGHRQIAVLCCQVAGAPGESVQQLLQAAITDI
ncbi:hypothetical protein WJX73_001498 [Symbiochloris irregularis]|uniref:Uncharacterized protein n=1 Tax=Symbiochloris irregularis TaxID=706552 RepID=A0AAW1NV63_9CHLO